MDSQNFSVNDPPDLGTLARSRLLSGEWTAFGIAIAVATVIFLIRQRVSAPSLSRGDV